MKKNVLKVAFMSLMLMTTNSASAQFDLNSIANQVLGGSTSSAQSEDSKSGGLINSLTTIFSSKKQANENNIIGTWTYSEPAIVLTSDNLLSNTAYKVAANKVESKLQSYLSQYGIKPGTFSITFNEDGTCTRTLKGKTSKGKWEIKDQKLYMTIIGSKSVGITTQITGKDMQLVADATKLLEMFKQFGANSTNSNIKTIASLLKGAKGMQAGITLRKQ